MARSLRQRLKELPRTAYWIGGGVIAFAGALVARTVADRFPLEARVPIWLAGSVVIFVGLAVLSLGGRAGRGTQRPEETDRAPQ